MISCVLKSSVLTCKRIHKKVIKRWLIWILFRFVTTIIRFLKLKVINRNLRINDGYVSVTTDSLRYVANLRFPYTVGPLQSHLQSQWLSKLPITLLWLHGKQSFLYVKVTALHYVLWDPLLLDFPIFATCSQVVIKELNHWANQPTLVLKDNSQRMIPNKNRFRWRSQTVYMWLWERKRGEKCMALVFNQRPLCGGFLPWCRNCFLLL